MRDSYEDRTYGEQLLEKLLMRLPADDYHTMAEPRIIDIKGNTHRPDFVVICRDFGLLVIEVKDWVEILAVDGERVRIRRRDGTEAIERDPIHQATGYARQLDRKCLEHEELTQRRNGKTILNFPYQIMIVLPHISTEIIKQIERTGVWSRYVVIGKEALKNVTWFEAAIRNLPWRWQIEQRLNDRMFNLIRGVVKPEWIVRNPQGQNIGIVSLEQEELITEKLSSEAENVVQSSHIRLVHGVAGSGKTLVLAKRAELLAARHPEQRVLVVTFNYDLAQSLKDILAHTEVKVQTFNEICYDILRDKWDKSIEVTAWLDAVASEDIAATGLSVQYIRQEIRWRKEADLYDDQRYLEADRRGRGKPLNTQKRQLINKIFNQYLAYQTELRRAGKPWRDAEDLHTEAYQKIILQPPQPAQMVDHILIDEAQDFAPSWFEIIRRLLKPEGSLFICDDPVQSLYQAYSWREKGIEVVGRTRTLRIPFRCTRLIHEAAYSLIESDELLQASEDVIAPLFESPEITEGSKPELRGYADLTQEVVQLAQNIAALIAAGEDPKNIAVLCHNRHHVKYWTELERRYKGLFIAPFERMKGLDFNTVFLPHLNTSFSGITDANAISEVRRRIYVGMTRARNRLVLSHHAALPEPLTPLRAYVYQM